MFRLCRALVRDERAATTSEYALLIVLIAAVIVLAVQGFGLTVGGLYSGVNSSLTQATGS